MANEGDRWVVIVARNNLDLLKQSVASAQAQDVPGSVRVMVVDNGSTGDVGSWLRCQRDVMSTAFQPQHSVSRAWNTALTYLFGVRGCERVLVINQDSVLRPDTYRWLENEGAEFVTGVGSGDPTCIERLFPNIPTSPDRLDYPIPRPDATRPHPDFSCFMISRDCYSRVGPFDEQFLGAYAEDSDMHVRLHRAGIHAYAIDLPFWHVGGGAQTIKRGSREEQERISAQAQRNREYFKSKWGFEVGSKEYYAFFGTGKPPHAEVTATSTPHG